MFAITGLRRLGFAAIALVLAVFGLLALASYLIPADQVRDAVRAEIRKVTGLDPDLRGATSISLFPYGSASFSDIVLGDGVSEPVPLAAQRLVARLKFLPLLAGRVEVAELTLVDPKINLDIKANGLSNWSPLVASLTRAIGPGARSGDKSDGVSFSEIRITGGLITINDATTNVQERLSGVEMSLAWPAISRSFAATGSVIWHGEPLETTITVGDFAAMLLGDRSTLKVRFAGEPVKVTFDGSLSIKPTLKLDGALAADTVSLRRLQIWTGQRPMPVGGFGPFSLKAQANVAGGTIALNSASIDLDGNTAEGVLTFATEGRQTWQGTLATESLDVTPYLTNTRLMGLHERAWNRVPIDLDGLTGFDLDLRLSAGKVTIGNVKTGRTGAAINLRAGKVTVTVGESQAFGGVIRGSAFLGKSDDGASFKTQLQFSDVDLEGSVGEVFGIRRVEGKGDISFAVEGSGENVMAIMRTLGGHATLAGRQGALSGINLEQLLRRLERRPLSGGNEFRTGRTPFDKLQVAARIAQGMATVDDVTLESGTVRLSINGLASIPARDFDLKGTVSLLANPKDGQGGFDLPFVVQGAWDDPLLLPDPQILIRRSGAAAPLLDALRDKRTRDAVRAAIDKLGGVKIELVPAEAEPGKDTAPADSSGAKQ